MLISASSVRFSNTISVHRFSELGHYRVAHSLRPGVFQSLWVVSSAGKCHTDSDSFADSDDDFSDEDSQNGTSTSWKSIVEKASSPRQLLETAYIHNTNQLKAKTDDCEKCDIAQSAIICQGPREFDGLAFENFLRARWEQHPQKSSAP